MRFPSAASGDVSEHDDRTDLQDPEGAGDESAAEEPYLPLRSDDSVLVSLFRSALFVLAGVVAAGFLLILLPESTVERLSQTLRISRSVPDQPERIAFLYLGDEMSSGAFHIRAVVRNITTEPIENLDATVRLYSSEGTLIETAIVRMETDIIAPDATSTFHLRYPGYRGQFSSYAVDFKLRQGEPVPYKDMRSSR